LCSLKVEEEESAGDNAGHDAVRFMRSSRKNAAELRNLPRKFARRSWPVRGALASLANTFDLRPASLEQARFDIVRHHRLTRRLL